MIISTNPFTFKDLPNRHENNFDVQPQRPPSTYQTSSLNFSSQVMALRPLTCAQPVTRIHVGALPAQACIDPDIASAAAADRPDLASPFSTFINSGSSSKLVVRRKRPKRVSRSASGNRPPPLRASIRHRPEFQKPEGPPAQTGTLLTE